MKQSFAFKLTLFVGGILLMFATSILMWLFLALGIESIGEFFLWTSVSVSILFVIIAGFLGLSD